MIQLPGSIKNLNSQYGVYDPYDLYSSLCEQKRDPSMSFYSKRILDNNTFEQINLSILTQPARNV